MAHVRRSTGQQIYILLLSSLSVVKPLTEGLKEIKYQNKKKKRKKCASEITLSFLCTVLSKWFFAVLSSICFSPGPYVDTLNNLVAKKHKKFW